MVDDREQIPQAAYINAQIIQEVVKMPGYKACVDRVATFHGISLDSYDLMSNSAHIVSLLYCLIAMPREIWNLAENHAIYAEMQQHDPLKYFKFELLSGDTDRKPTLYEFLRRLRNAVAHAQFCFPEPDRFVFWGLKPTSTGA